MKKNKILALLLTFCLVLSLCACGTSASTTETEAEETASTETASTEETAAEETATEETTAEEPAEETLDYPVNDIEIIIPYKVGGTTDLAVRGVLDSIPADTISTTINVTNEVGGSGLIGTEDFLSHSNDGYTLGLVNCDLVLNYVTGATEINPMEDMIPLAAVEQDPYLLLAKSDAEFQTFAEFISYCEANPGEAVVGVTAVGSIPNLLGTILNQAGLDVTVIPYDSATDAVAGVLSGESDICISAMAPCVGNIESGDLIALAVTSSERSAASPDVPTMAEVDERFADVNLLSWIMIALPAGTDENIVNFWKEALSEAVASDSYAETRSSFYFEEITIGTDELESFISSQAEYYKTLTE